MERLDYLYLLTVADIAATSPKLWNNWKGSLLWELYTLTSRAIAEGSSNIFDREHHIQQSKAELRERLLMQGMKPEAIDALWASLPQNVFLSYSSDQLEWTAGKVLGLSADCPVLVTIREVRERGISELLVHSPDYDGLFAAVTTVIDEIGLDVLSARVGTTTLGKSFDLFQLMDSNGRSLNDIDCERLKTRLRKVLATSSLPKPMVRRLPRRLRPFSSAPEIHFSAAQGGEKTLMDIVCLDRPGLLSDVSTALVECGIRVHDAKITTMGERVEDAFILSDNQDEPLSRDTRAHLLKTLTDTLRKK